MVMWMICIMNTRGGKSNIAIPEGCYSNAFAFLVTITTAGDLAAKLLNTAVDLEMKRRRGLACLFPRPKPPHAILTCAAVSTTLAAPLRPKANF
jgi:hypothetical protein